MNLDEHLTIFHYKLSVSNKKIIFHGSRCDCWNDTHSTNGSISIKSTKIMVGVVRHTLHEEVCIKV